MNLLTLRSQISHVKLWLINEISMVGHRMLSFIDQRLQEVNNSNRPFGGASIVVLGDLFQLPPVMDMFIFSYLSSLYELSVQCSSSKLVEDLFYRV